MDFKQIQELIKMINKSNIGELTVEQKDFRVTIKQKEENYVRTLGLKIKRNAISQETYSTYYPAELYQTYAAFESGAVEANYEARARVVRERKSSTSYLEPLDSSAFDVVINPTGLEPVVQCTLYLKVRYSLTP